MTRWDREHPGAGDVAGLDVLATGLTAHADTLAEVTAEVRALASELTAAWSGEAATAWADRTGVVADRVGALEPEIAPVAAALTSYTREVTEIGTQARTAAGSRDDARARYSAAQVEAVTAAFGDPSAAQAALAHLRDAGAQVVAAENALTDLSDRRREADTALIGVLHDRTPQAWTDGGARLAGLDPLRLAQGTDPVALAVWAASLPDTPEGDAALRWRLGDLSPSALDDLLAAHPHLATRLMRPDLDALRGACPDLADALTFTDPARRLNAVAAAFAALTAAEQARIARTHPWAVGNIDGAPLAARAAANRIAIRAAIPDAERRIAEIDLRIAENEALLAGMDGGPPGDETDGGARSLVQDTLDRLRAERQVLTDRIPWCQGLLAEPVGAIDSREPNPPAWHQVVLFDPDAGRFGEVIGSLDAANLAVLVGGTGTNLTNMDGQAERAWSFVTSDKSDLAVITYLGGPMPQALAADAPFRTFADRLAPHLAGFANGVRAAGGTPLTVVGHSYGGLVVGWAEANGMVVDRVLYVEASGSAVRDSHEYTAPETPRYSMTAPGDPIEGVQALGAHGRDPDEVTGTVRVETGRVYDESGAPVGLVQGAGAHDGVFAPDTDAFRNIRAIMTGERISLWTPPVDTWEVTPGGRLVRTGRDYPMADPDYVPPTEEVR